MSEQKQRGEKSERLVSKPALYRGCMLTGNFQREALLGGRSYVRWSEVL